MLRKGEAPCLSEEGQQQCLHSSLQARLEYPVCSDFFPIRLFAKSVTRKYFLDSLEPVFIKQLSPICTSRPLKKKKGKSLPRVKAQCG